MKLINKTLAGAIAILLLKGSAQQISPGDTIDDINTPPGHIKINYTLQISDINLGSYDINNGIVYPATFTITKQKMGRANYAVTASVSSNTGTYLRRLSYGSYSLEYHIYTSSDMTYEMKAPPQATRNEVISGWLAGQDEQIVTLTMYIAVPANQLVPPGIYTDTIEIAVYPFYNSPPPPDDARQITISVLVPPFMNLAIVEPGANFTENTSLTLDFGILSPGKTLGCDLIVIKNCPCKLTISSLNNGTLKHKTDDQAKVSYIFRFSGTPTPLTTPVELLLNNSTLIPGGQRFPITITIGQFKELEPGEYFDIITITLSAP